MLTKISVGQEKRSVALQEAVSNTVPLVPEFRAADIRALQYLQLLGRGMKIYPAYNDAARTLNPHELISTYEVEGNQWMSSGNNDSGCKAIETLRYRYRYLSPGSYSKDV